MLQFLVWSLILGILPFANGEDATLSIQYTADVDLKSKDTVWITANPSGVFAPYQKTVNVQIDGVSCTNTAETLADSTLVVTLGPGCTIPAMTSVTFNVTGTLYDGATYTSISLSQPGCLSISLQSIFNLYPGSNIQGIFSGEPVRFPNRFVSVPSLIVNDARCATTVQLLSTKIVSFTLGSGCTIPANTAATINVCNASKPGYSERSPTSTKYWSPVTDGTNFNFLLIDYVYSWDSNPNAFKPGDIVWITANPGTAFVPNQKPVTVQISGVTCTTTAETLADSTLVVNLGADCNIPAMTSSSAKVTFKVTGSVLGSTFLNSDTTYTIKRVFSPSPSSSPSLSTSPSPFASLSTSPSPSAFLSTSPSPRSDPSPLLSPLPSPLPPPLPSPSPPSDSPNGSVYFSVKLPGKALDFIANATLQNNYKNSVAITLSVSTSAIQLGIVTDVSSATAGSHFQELAAYYTIPTMVLATNGVTASALVARINTAVSSNTLYTNLASAGLPGAALQEAPKTSSSTSFQSPNAFSLSGANTITVSYVVIAITMLARVALLDECF